MILNENGELPREYFDRLDTLFANTATNYRKYAGYVEGKNPAILAKPAQAAPDNRVPVPFARKIVSTLKGYMAKPGYITYKAEDEAYEDKLKETLDDNDEELLTGELLRDALTSGYGYEILRVEDDGGLKVKQYRISPDKGIPVYDDTLADNLIAFVHQEAIEEPSGDIHYLRTVYYASEFVVYKSGDGGGAWREIDRQPHPFGDVPVAVYHCNMDELPVFDHVIAMIDEHDKIISSDYANELERFANAYLLALKNVTAEVAEKVKELRIFDGLGADGEIKDASAAMAFLTKPSRGEDVAEAASRFERLIYEMSMVPAPGDDKMGSASGIAMRWKSQPMELLASDVEGYFSKGLQRRFMLIGQAFSVLFGLAVQAVTINFRRNIPIDLKDIAETAGALKGIVSDKTILDIFPGDVVPNKVAEWERIEEERSERLPIIDDSSRPI